MWISKREYNELQERAEGLREIANNAYDCLHEMEDKYVLLSEHYRHLDEMYNEIRAERDFFASTCMHMETMLADIRDAVIPYGEDR